MKKHSRILSFAAGMVTTVALFACITGALAASGTYPLTQRKSYLEL